MEDRLVKSGLEVRYPLLSTMSTNRCHSSIESKNGKQVLRRDARQGSRRE